MSPTGAALVAIVVSFLAFLATPVGVWLAGRQRLSEKIEDWRRQDEVATRAAADAEKVAQAATLLQATNEIQVRQAAAAAKAAADTAAKLDEIQGMNLANHLLLNSNLTQQMQIQYDLHVSLVASLRREIALMEAAGRAPAASTLAELKASQAKITELGPVIAERLTQTKAADAEIAKTA